ncbi:TadE/TadG family type IV pilus assembly protein [Methylobacterium iners]|uniref:TadE-like domain-containing protein n=1 Tax=Methylobacterium iners TaxID=418707 RepID=A0ABQ4RWJ9_9HYPH|nr:TadE/TadG family type IV pilus assembly protein [Methylobacterium iners]GJD95226.1 hypothetical protein OCOJLMKI_2437 [Methylobacterium iners]
MTHIVAPPSSRTAVRSFFREDRGTAAVEFGLIATVLAAILGGIIDLSFMIGANRDAERASALIVKTLASCPPRTTANSGFTHQGSDCVTQTMRLYTDGNNGRFKNIVLGLPNADLKLLYFTRVGTEIETCFGVDFVEDLGPNVKPTVLSVTRDDDTGVVARIVSNYTPLMPSFIIDHGLSAALSSSQYTVDVQGSGPGSRCSKSSS